MGAVQGMVGQLDEQKDGVPGSDNAMNMLTTMMGSLGGVSGSSEQGGVTGTPDLAGMMQGMMQGLTASNNDSISGLIDNSVKDKNTFLSK